MEFDIFEGRHGQCITPKCIVELVPQAVVLLPSLGLELDVNDEHGAWSYDSVHYESEAIIGCVLDYLEWQILVL